MRPQDMTVTKSDLAAETIASAIWDAANQHDNGTAVGASVRRSLRRHARELLDLHDIAHGDVLTDVRVETEQLEGLRAQLVNGQG